MYCKSGQILIVVVVGTGGGGVVWEGSLVDAAKLDGVDGKRCMAL